MLNNIPAALRPADASDEDVLYVADADLNVIFVNTAWRSFAGVNRGNRTLGAGWNSNLLANFSGSERLRWQAIYAALQAGRLEVHEENFICPSPVERRMYRMRIRRHVDASGRLTHLSHHAARVDGTDKASVLGERLRALDRDPEATADACKRFMQSRPPDTPSIKTAAHIAPLHEVGGDLLWHRPWADGSADFVIADVMGHGLDAARLAAKILTLLETRAEVKLTVAANVARLNSALHALPKNKEPMQRGPLFATGLYLRVDPASRIIVLCSFGHSGPIFSTYGRIQPRPGMPVGMVANELAGSWPEMELRIDEYGTRFILYTDGLSEQFNEVGEMFGDAGIERVFRRTASWPSSNMMEAILGGVDAFRGGAIVKDDRALLAVEICSV